MPYIGKSPQNGVRNRFVYNATTSSQTAFTGSDLNGNTLSISDNLYTDVYLNGILLQPSEDYSVTSTTVTLVSGASLNDVCEIIVFDIFSVGDTVSASSGGTFNDRVNFTHGTHSNNVGTFINTTANSNSNGVVHVKQSSATNQPTMVIEQTGEGGNQNDTQGLHIKTAGQNQGIGKALRVTTENSNLNSGTAFDPLTVFNGGDVQISGNLVIGTSGKGIDFSSASGSASGATASVLDDYETGTMSLEMGGLNNISVSSARIEANNNYSGGQAFYEKIGNLCYIQAYFFAQQTTTQASGNLQIKGLPFTAHANGGSFVSQSYNLTLPASDGQQVAIFQTNGTTNLAGLRVRNGATWQDTPASVMPNNTAIYFRIAGVYKTQ